MNALATATKTFAAVLTDTLRPCAIRSPATRRSWGAAAAGRRIGSIPSCSTSSPVPRRCRAGAMLGRPRSPTRGHAGRRGPRRSAARAGVLARTLADELARLFAGIADLCSHRLDAWITSLALVRLADRRRKAPAGLSIGAYGWVVGLRPSAPSQAAPDEHMLAPSMDHAVTAAILRAGYQAHRATGDAAMAVDLSSARVRDALRLIDGVRQGQTLGALLGYRFERRLQEASQPDHLLGPYIAPFRKLAPMDGGSLPAGAAESVAASRRGGRAGAIAHLCDQPTPARRFRSARWRRSRRGCASIASMATSPRS